MTPLHLLHQLVIAAFVIVANGQLLAPAQDINLPSSSSASEPLKWLGANSPWYAGPNVNGVTNDVPSGCTVEQAAYVVRHGSRYPDSGAYGQWVTLYNKIHAAQYKASGSLGFLPSWKPVLANPTAQISQESITGYKESHDLGYTLRVRYPSFYTDGQSFMAWANLYPRVVQTARMFVQGYLGPFASTLGNVISVNSTGSPLATGNSLAPSDSCPNFVDTSGGANATAWDDVYLPPITARVNRLLKGNLNFTASDVSLFPYLCGFESQITGTLSPWCGVFTDAELLQYEYRQDLRYYYGVGPGTILPQQMFLPFLNNLVSILQHGPGLTGTEADGNNFTLPNLLMAFANDGQIAELAAAIGVFDSQVPLPSNRIPLNWMYISSRFVSMRGTVAFERLNCHHTTNETYVRILLNDAVYPVTACQDGPGKSCLLSKYASLVANKYAAAGNWHDNCNVTNPQAPTVVKGASFFTDLTLPFLANVAP